MTFNPVMAGEAKEFEIPEEGMYDAVCSGIVACGWQKGEYQGKPNKKNIIFLYFELNQLDSEGNPFTLFKKFNNTTSERGQLKPFFEKWTKLPLEHTTDLSELVGMQAKLVITHATNQDGSKTYANIDNALNNQGSEMRVTSHIIYDCDAHNQVVFETLPKFMKEMITNRMTPKELAEFKYDD